MRQGAVAGGVSLSSAGLQGVGPGEAGPPLSPGFTPWDPGGGAGPRKPQGVDFSMLPHPALPPPRGQRCPRRCGEGPPPRALGRGGAGCRARGTPSCWWVWGSSAGTCQAEEREKRSAPWRFCKIAVTTLARVWVGEWDESDSENGNLNQDFHLTTHSFSTPGPFHLPLSFNR